MIRSLWIAKTGMEGQQTKLDTISNNLANVGTNGFKRGGVVFEDLMYQNLRQTGAASSDQSVLPTGLQVGLGVRAVATTRNFAQGTLQQSSSDFDLADQGQGLLPGHAARRHHRLHPRRLVPGRRQRPAGHQRPACAAAGHHHPGQCAEGHHRQADGTVSVTLPGQATPQAWARSAGQLHQPGRPGAARAEPVCRKRGVGRAAGGRAGHQRPGHAAAGLGRGQQRQRGRGAGGDDRHPARLRAELQGHPDLGPDAAASGQL
jgi:flagellar basal-body rod protein FlgG